MRRRLYHYAGLVSVALGLVGIALPILPAVPFLILAAWCFGKSNPAWEAWLLAHSQFGPHIRAWRDKGAIARGGKLGATGAFVVSIAISFFVTPWPWPLLPAGIAVVTLSWIWTRPQP